MKFKILDHITKKINGKTYIEGKIKVDLETARLENNEADNWVLNNYPEMKDMILERLF